MALQTKYVIFLHAGYLLLFTQIIVLCETLDKSKYKIKIGRPSDQLYTPATQICCNGFTVKKSDPQTACCGNQTYNPDKQVCCNDYITSKTSEMRCCNNQLYNSTTHNCTLYVDQANINNDGTLLVTHDNTFSVIPITEENYFPCGNGAFNLKTSICCGGKAIPVSGLDYPSCCGEKVFDSKLEFCCFNRYGKDFLIVIPSLDYSPDCCNGGPFDPHRQVCVPANGGTIIDIPDKNQKWCEDQFIDTREKICCPEKYVVAKGKANHTQCCGNASFSPSEEFCCDYNLTAVSSGMKCCPGHGPYDPKTDTCCSVENKINSEQKTQMFKNKLGPCCYLTAYDQTKESCCGISVIAKSPDGQSGCCEYNMNGTAASLDEIIAYKTPVNSLHSDLFKKLDGIRKSMAAYPTDALSSVNPTPSSNSSSRMISLPPWVFLLYVLNFVNKNFF